MSFINIENMAVRYDVPKDKGDGKDYSVNPVHVKLQETGMPGTDGGAKCRILGVYSAPGDNPEDTARAIDILASFMSSGNASRALVNLLDGESVQLDVDMDGKASTKGRVTTKSASRRRK